MLNGLYFIGLIPNEFVCFRQAQTYFEVDRLSKVHALPVRKITNHVQKAPNPEAIARRQQKKLEKQQKAAQLQSESKKQKVAKAEKVEKIQKVDLKAERAAKELVSFSIF